MAETANLSNILKLLSPSDKKEYTDTYMKAKNCKQLFQKYLDDLKDTSSLDVFGKNNLFLLKRMWSLNKDAKHLHKNVNPDKALDHATGRAYCEARGLGLNTKLGALLELVRRLKCMQQKVNFLIEVLRRASGLATELNQDCATWNRPEELGLPGPLKWAPKSTVKPDELNLGPDAGTLLQTVGYPEYQNNVRFISEMITRTNHLITMLQNNVKINKNIKVDWRIINGVIGDLRTVDMGKINSVKSLYDFAVEHRLTNSAVLLPSAWIKIELATKNQVCTVEEAIDNFFVTNKGSALRGFHYFERKDLEEAINACRESTKADVSKNRNKILNKHESRMVHGRVGGKLETTLIGVHYSWQSVLPDLVKEYNTSVEEILTQGRWRPDKFSKLGPYTADWLAKYAKGVDSAFKKIVNLYYNNALTLYYLNLLKSWDLAGVLKLYVGEDAKAETAEAATESVRKALTEMLEQERMGGDDCSLKRFLEANSSWAYYLTNWKNAIEVYQSSYAFFQKIANEAAELHYICNNFREMCSFLYNEAVKACQNYQPPKKQSSKHKNAIQAIQEAKKAIDNNHVPAKNIGEKVLTALKAIMKDFNDPSVSKGEIKNLYTAIQNRAKTLK